MIKIPDPQTEVEEVEEAQKIEKLYFLNEQNKLMEVDILNGEA